MQITQTPHFCTTYEELRTLSWHKKKHIARNLTKTEILKVYHANCTQFNKSEVETHIMNSIKKTNERLKLYELL
ncbi:MAG: hypothetical protein RR239_07780 [Oscillospiraceae bacterium]